MKKYAHHCFISSMHSIKIKLLSFVFILLLFKNAVAQKINFSALDKSNLKSASFQIIGQVGNEIFIYQKVNKQHIIRKYDQDMRNLDELVLDFIPEKSIKIDFVKSKNELVVFFQCKKESYIYCQAAVLNYQENKFQGIITMDSVKVKQLDDKGYFSIAISENKKRFLLYFRRQINDSVIISANTYNHHVIKIDEFEQTMFYDQRRNVLTDIIIDNEGNYIFTKQSKSNSNDNFELLEIINHQFGSDSIVTINCPLQKKYLENALLKIDNMNKRYIVNAYYYSTKRGHVEGLFTAILKSDDISYYHQAFNKLPETFKSSNNNFDNLVPKEIVVKNNGGFVLVAEDCFTEVQNINNSWNRNYNSPFGMNMGNVYFDNPYMLNNRNNNYSPNQLTRYYNNNILIASIDSALNFLWGSSIEKKQYSEVGELMLSYSYLNPGYGLDFLYIEKDNQRYTLSHNRITSSGEVNHFPNIRSNEENYEFIPRIGKQISSNSIIIPFYYLKQTGFAKIDF